MYFEVFPGWNMLTSLLFQNGSTSEAETLLEEGRNGEFLPDNKVFTESIKHNCKQGKIVSKSSLCFLIFLIFS